MQLNHGNCATGYDLLEVEGHQWIMKSENGPIFTGSLKEIGVYAVRTLGFELSEFEYAVMEMYRNKHNGANFGVFKTFLYSYDKEFDFKEVG